MSQQTGTPSGEGLPLIPVSRGLGNRLVGWCAGAAVRASLLISPPLGHEYQFDLDTDAGQLFLHRLLTFLRQRLAAAPQPPGTDPARQPGTAP